MPRNLRVTEGLQINLHYNISAVRKNTAPSGKDYK